MKAWEAWAGIILCVIWAIIAVEFMCQMNTFNDCDDEDED